MCISKILQSLLVMLVVAITSAPLVTAATVTVINLNDSGPGSLRQAITDSNPSDTINFSVIGTITLTSGELAITKDLNIQGPGSNDLIISGNNTSRVFHITAGMVSISDVTISNGYVIGGGGAGVRNLLSTVALKNVNIRNNQSEYMGGGVANVFGTMSIMNSSINNNTLGGVRNSNGSTLTITNSSISNNIGHRGGGLSVEGGSVSLFGSTISNNRAGLGGGIDNQDGTLTVINSTITGNEVYDVVILNPVGGGISNNEDLLLINSTVTNNTAVGEGDGLYNRGTTTLLSTIIADHTNGVDCYDYDATYFPIISLGYNLDSDNTCQLTQATDLPATDPLLAPLADNGGYTETHALLDGSSAIDAGGANCTDADGNPILFDQRGETRPVDGNGDGEFACDIGSYEVQLANTIAEIDIKPENNTNSINPASNGVIPVAVLTSGSFDALLVSPDTVRFGPGGAVKAHSQAHVDDVDYDGDMDLLFHFQVLEANIRCDDTEATLMGQTWDGLQFSGTDSVHPVGCR